MPEAFLLRQTADGVSDPFIEQFVALMNEDLNTAGAIGLMIEKVREMNKLLDSCDGSIDEPVRLQLANDRQKLLLAGRVLGLLEKEPAQFFDELSGFEDDSIDPAEIEKMIEDRKAARKAKDWSRADEIRDHLKEMGVVLEDGPQGTTWRMDV